MKSNIILAIIAAIVLIFIIYYLNRNDEQPAAIRPNPKSQYQPTIETLETTDTRNDSRDDRYDDIIENNQHQLDNYVRPDMSSYVSDPISVDDIINGCYSDNIDSDHLDNLDNSIEDESKNFTFRGQKFKHQSDDAIKDQFNIKEMMPKEIENWFDTSIIQGTKKIKGTHMIHPKAHMGQNTNNVTRRNGSRDLRGDIPIPKLNITPFNISTIEQNNIPNGICAKRG